MHDERKASSCPHKVSLQAWLIFGLLIVAYLFIPFHRFCLSLLAVDIMQEVHVDAVFFGVLSSALFLIYGLMQLPAGLLADLLGPHRIFPAFFVISGVGSVLMGLAQTQTMLLGGRILIGFGLAIVFVSGVKVIANWFSPDIFARINGLFLGLGGIGMLIASGLLPMLCESFGWRMTFVGGGILAFIIAVLMLFWLQDAPKNSQPLEKRPALESIREMRSALVTILMDRDYWFLCMWGFCVFSLHNSFGGLWGGPYLMHVHHLDMTQCGYVLNMMGVGVLAGGVISGWLAESVCRSYKKVMLGVAILQPVLFLVLVLWGEGFSVWLLAVWFFFLSAAGMGSYSLGIAYGCKRYGSSLAATVAGLFNTLPCFGVFLFQPLVGYILEQHRMEGASAFPAEAYAWACVPFIGFGIVCIICTLLLHDEKSLPQS